jgi:hypothetical protein
LQTASVHFNNLDIIGTAEHVLCLLVLFFGEQGCLVLVLASGSLFQLLSLSLSFVEHCVNYCKLDGSFLGHCPV